MSARVRVIVLAALSVAQVAAAGWSIARYESTLASGTAYKIRVAPVDPADAFRGRYVAVQPSMAVDRPIAPETESLLQEVQSGTRTAYVALATDAQGFARAAQILPKAPPSGDYLAVERVWSRWNQERRPGERVQVVGYVVGFAFDRYYMNEAVAPTAESRYLEAARRNANTRAWLTVRVKNGAGVIEGLFIDGVAIEEIVARSKQ